MKVITKLFRELFVRFPWHFLLLFGLVFSQALLNALSVVTIAPIIDFLMERTVEESSVFTHFFGSALGLVWMRSPGYFVNQH